MDSNNKVVVIDSASKGYNCDPFAQLTGQHILNGMQIIDKDVKQSEAEVRSDVKDAEADIRYGVKDSEANIRHDVLFEGQEGQKTSLEVEARLKDRLTIDRNAYDAQFMHLGEKICSTEKEVIKSGYEARLEALKTADRVTDKIQHAQEEIREDIGELSKELMECCCENKLLATTNTGLLNQLVKSLIK